MRYVIIDHQSTGVCFKSGDRLVELVAIELVGEEMIHQRTFRAFIDPERDIPPCVVRRHGITTEQLEQECARPFREIAQQFLHFIEASTLVVYHCEFDLSFINHELNLAGLGNIDHMPHIDIRETAMRIWPDQSQLPNALCDRLSLSRKQNHSPTSSIDDACILADIFRALNTHIGIYR